MDPNCPICLESFIDSDESIQVNQCGHRMHGTCMHTAIRTGWIRDIY